MRIVIGQPPAVDNMTVMQQRQAYVFKNPSFMYPVVPAYAATLLSDLSHEVHWMDGVAAGQTWDQYLDDLTKLQPELLIWEAKTPTIKKIWALSRAVSAFLPDTTLVIFGDHVTALPYETYNSSDVDCVMVGGNIDYGIVEMLDFMQEFKYLPAVWHCPETIPRDLPVLDRELTKWRLYAERNGNFKHLPGTYVQFARDCWWRKSGGCSFCSWTVPYPNYNVCTVDSAIRELENCMSLGIREVFDDSGTFPRGAWLEDFCERFSKINKRGRHGHRIRLGCNVRAHGFGNDEYLLMRKAGFRFVLLGMESANQHTLDRLNKGEKVEDMGMSLRMAKRAKLDTHLTVMVGYEWETEKEVLNTLDTARRFFARGLIDSLQATICVPYPGTRLFNESKLKTADYSKFDMSDTVFDLNYDVKKYVREFYKASLHPMNLLRRVWAVNTWDDFTYLMRTVKAFFNHVEDFK